MKKALLLSLVLLAALLLIARLVLPGIIEIAVLTQEMLRQGFTETEIRAVMDGNVLAFLRRQLPAQ